MKKRLFALMLVCLLWHIETFTADEIPYAEGRASSLSCKPNVKSVQLYPQLGGYCLIWAEVDKRFER